MRYDKNYIRYISSQSLPVHSQSAVKTFTSVCVFQACIPGFRRINGNLYNGVCEACYCHGHTSQCHELTGHCLVRWSTGRWRCLSVRAQNHTTDALCFTQISELKRNKVVFFTINKVLLCLNCMLKLSQKHFITSVSRMWKDCILNNVKNILSIIKVLPVLWFYIIHRNLIYHHSINCRNM